MTENVCEMLSTLNGKHFTVLGKSIAFQKEPRTLSDTSSINLTKSATNLIPMRLSPRIKQLYLPVCLHEMKHEIANHYRDAKYKKATKTRAKVKRSAIAAALHRLRKRNRISKFATTAATASTAMHRQKMEHRRFILSQREVLQIPSFTFPRSISQEPTSNVSKGRQTLCNRQNCIGSIDVIENLTSSLISCLFQKGHRKLFAKHFTSFDVTNQANTNLKLYESVGCRPSVKRTLQQHKAQTCRRRSQKQACATNQSHVEIQRSNATTKTPPPNCNRQVRKTYSSNTNDDNHSCINNTSSSKTNYNKKNTKINSQTEWYIQLASNCYRNGFQLHVNHLDECSKHPIVLQKKPVQAAFLRLPSSALLFRSPSLSYSLPPPPKIDSIDSAISFVPDLVLCSSLKSITVTSHCDKTYTSNSFSDSIPNHCRPHQLNTGKINRIYCKKPIAQTCDPLHYNNSIDVHARLPIINTIPIARQPATAKKQFNVLNAKNNMNSVAVDANNLQQNLQLSCQAIQNNYQNNNLTVYREYQASGQQEPQPISNKNNNYQQHHWLDKSNPNSISLTDPRRLPTAYQKGIEVRSTEYKGDIVNDLIDTFNTSLDVSEAKQIQLPQIILSDFSSNQTTPPTTPLFFTVQNPARTLSEHPPQLHEFQILSQHSTI